MPAAATAARDVVAAAAVVTGAGPGAPPRRRPTPRACTQRRNSSCGSSDVRGVEDPGPAQVDRSLGAQRPAPAGGEQDDGEYRGR